MSRKIRRFAVAFSALALFADRAWAQSPPAAPETLRVGDWKLAPLVELRTRGEYRRDPVDLGGSDARGQVGARVRDAWGILGRARLGVGAEHESGHLSAQLTLEDAYAWGSPSPSGVLEGSAKHQSLGAYEAYVKVQTASERAWSLSVGRQRVSWGDGRLVGAADWAPVGRALDAVRAHAPIGVIDVELLAAVLDSPAPLGVAASDTFGPSHAGAELYGLNAGWVILGPALKVELTALARIARGSSLALDTSRFSRARDSGETYTGSLRAGGETHGWMYSAEGAYQLGQVAAGALAGAALDRQAYAAAAYVGRQLDMLALTPTIRAGGSLASGDSGGTTYTQFDPILPDVHVWYGAMDAFAWSNVMDAYGSVTVVPVTDLTVMAEYRYARLADGRGEWVSAYLSTVGTAPNRQEELGHEVDVVVGWRPAALPLVLTGGYSVFLLGDGARSIVASSGRGQTQPDGSFAPAALAHFGYVQATLRIP